jgi:hypothetical protein
MLSTSVRRSLLTLVAVATCLALAAPVFAQTRPAAPTGAAATTGRISGRALEKGKDPVSFANVIVMGTRLGTMTDETGAYVIGGVPVGTYTVKLQAIGYDPVIQSVQVNAGETAVVNFAVGQTKVVKEVETIEVRAEKRIDTKSSTTKQSISSEKLKEIPVDNLSQAVATKAGVVAQGGELHFRGGRGGEVKVQLDGVESRRLKLGAPITFMALGYGTMLISSLAAIASVSAAEDIENARWSEYDEDGYDYVENGDGRVDADRSPVAMACRT